MIPILTLAHEGDRTRVESLLRALSLDPADLALGRGERAKQMAGVQVILADVAERGDAAVVESGRRFDDPEFTGDQLRVKPGEMAEAVARVPGNQLSAI